MTYIPSCGDMNVMQKTFAALRSPIKYKVINETSFHQETPEEVCVALESARINGTRIKIHYGDPNTGLDWNDSESGTVYRTGDHIKLPKLNLTINSVGGSPILDHMIVKITEYSGKVTYEHFAYHNPHPKVKSRKRIKNEFSRSSN